MASREGWYWGGYAMHWIMAPYCRFHLGTILPTGYLVSTVGDAQRHPERTHEPITVGAGPETFETMVFRCDPTPDEDLNAVVHDWCEVDSARYSDSREAERGHYAMCEKYAAQQIEAGEGEHGE